ncbi:MAG: ABC transporter substrate-binding protein [Burkholderiales bacterium]
MNRRRFIATFAWGIALTPRVHGQPAQKSPVVGILHTAPAARSTSMGIYIEGMRELGYVDGRNIVLAIRSAEGRPRALPAFAAELVRLDARVIVAVGPVAVRAARDATSAIPIVGVDLESDPVEPGFVRTLARPGGNVTGLFLDFPELAAKWLDLLREAAPAVRRVGILWDSTTGTAQLAAVRAAAARFAIEPMVVEFRSTDELDAAFKSTTSAGVTGAVMLSSPIIAVKSSEIAAFTVKHRLAGISPFRQFADAGGLLAYGPNLRDFYRRVPRYVDKILKGASPSDLPVEQPTTFDLVTNAKTAQALGLALPNALVARANAVIR